MVATHHSDTHLCPGTCLNDINTPFAVQANFSQTPSIPTNASAHVPNAQQIALIAALFNLQDKSSGQKHVNYLQIPQIGNNPVQDQRINDVSTTTTTRTTSITQTTSSITTTISAKDENAKKDDEIMQTVPLSESEMKQVRFDPGLIFLN